MAHRTSSAHLLSTVSFSFCLSFIAIICLTSEDVGDGVDGETTTFLRLVQRAHSVLPHRPRRVGGT